MKSDMKTGEMLETIAIFIAMISIMPVAYWWHTGSLPQHRFYFIYLFIMLCMMGYVFYRRMKRLSAAFKASKKRGSGPGPRVPPFYNQ